MTIRHGTQRTRIRVGTVVTLLSAAACVPSPDRARHTVEDYRANDPLRAAVLAECANDPGTLAKAPDCQNAKLAETLGGFGSARKLPPLNLPLVVPGVNDPRPRHADAPRHSAAKLAGSRERESEN